MNDVRSLLADQIEKLIDNKTTPAALNAITNATGKILSTVKMELEYAKLTNGKLRSGFLQLEEPVKIAQAGESETH